MTNKQIPYRIPTLKVTQAVASDPKALYQALTDYSNDVQSYLQQLASVSNQNFRALQKSITTDETNITEIETDLGELVNLNPSSIGSNGYLTLSNGVVLQWMSGSGNNPGVSNALPFTFPNNIFSAFASPSGAAVSLEVTLTDKGHITVTTAVAGAQNCFILAIGD